MALPMMLGISFVSGVALYFTSKATNATSSYSPLSGDPEETGSLICLEAFDSGRSVGEGGGTMGRRAEVEPPGVWEAAKRKFRWAKAKLTSRYPEENAASSLLSGDHEEILEMESAGGDIFSPSPESFESGRYVEAAEVENPMGTMIVEKVTECNIPSPVAPDVIHAVEVDPMAVNAALVDSDVEDNSCCNVHGVVAEAAEVGDLQVGEEGGARERRGKVELPGLWEAAKRTFIYAKAKLKSSAEWMVLDPDVVRRILKCGAEWLMLDPDVVRRILKSMFSVVADSVVNQAFKSNTVGFKLCTILISELKRCI